MMHEFINLTRLMANAPFPKHSGGPGQMGRLKAVKVLQALITDKDPEDHVFERYARPRGMDRVSAMMMKRFRKVITDKKLSMHSLRHRMKDKLRNTGRPEAVSMAILGHSTNTVAANYGSGYAIEVMREHMEKAWFL
jgi:integrase